MALSSESHVTGSWSWQRYHTDVLTFPKLDGCIDFYFILFFSVKYDDFLSKQAENGIFFFFKVIATATNYFDKLKENPAVFSPDVRRSWQTAASASNEC